MQGSSSSATLIPQQTQSAEIDLSMTLTLNMANPWTSQVNNSQFDATPGNVTFQLPPGSGYDTHVKRQELLDTRQNTPKASGHDPLTPSNQSDDSWALASYTPGSYAASHGSPHSHESPPSHPSSPQDEREHRHILNFEADSPKSKLPRGRQRGLTDTEKKQAREVRDAKACWACHISKTKVSHSTAFQRLPI